MGTTTTREYRTIDKSAWGDGPWQSEPDKLSWTDEATGLPCLVVRGPSGALCGYVGVAEDHAFYRKEYSHAYCGHRGCREHTPEGALDVHGGITYSAACQDDMPEAEGVCHIPQPGQPEHVWWFGFDAAHSGDFTPGSHARLPEAFRQRYPVPRDWEVYRDLAYVREQVAELARQLIAVTGMEQANA